MRLRRIFAAHDTRNGRGALATALPPGAAAASAGGLALLRPRRGSCRVNQSGGRPLLAIEQAAGKIAGRETAAAQVIAVAVNFSHSRNASVKNR
jgi:hypothetical protein